MAKIFLFLFLIILVIGGIVVFLYFTYEKPIQEESKVEYVNLSLYTFDGDKQVITEFKILKDGFEFQNGTTAEGGGLFISVPVNHTYLIETINQDYYTAYIERNFFGSNFPNQRIELYLESPGNLTIEKKGNFLNNSLTLITDKEIKNLSFCITWSVDIIKIAITNLSNMTLSEIPKFPKYKNYDLCYYLGTLTKDNPFLLSVSPSVYMTLNKADYINLVFIDQDCIKDDCSYELENKDIGLKDMELKINNI